MTQATYLDLIRVRGIDTIVHHDAETGKPTLKTQIVGHVFQSGQFKVHSRGCRAVKMEARGTAHANKVHGNIDFAYIGLTLEEMAFEHFTDFINHEGMSEEEALAFFGQGVCKCVRNA